MAGDRHERTASSATVDGYVAPGFGAVADAFAKNFAVDGDVGAACAVHLDGRLVVDLWGGTADAATGRPWDRDTIVVTYSTTKGVTACCAHLLAERGVLDVDAPVATYWPEFAAAGKQDIPVRWLLSHQAGLPYVDATLTLDDVVAWDPVVAALAAQAPVWEPGTAHGYHATTFGWLVGEVIRRVAGRSVGAVLRDELAVPLDLDLWLGLPGEHEHRVAPLARAASAGDSGRPVDPKLAELVAQFTGPDTLLGKALSAPSGLLRSREVWNTRALHAAEVPAAGAIGDARSLSRLYAAMIGSVDGRSRVLGPAQVDTARTRQTWGPDLALHIESSFGLGFMVSSPFARYGGAGGFGHNGNGGSVAFADPESGIAFAYVTNGMRAGVTGDKRSRRLVGAAFGAAGVEPVHV